MTNQEFAKWLTESVAAKNIFYVSQGESLGSVFDSDRHLIYQTLEANFLSQILSEMTSLGKREFRALAGKENHPVILVTFYGAHAFSKDHGGRLPTELEWEKGASIPPVLEGKPPQKYLFGCQSDTLDRSLANYNDQEKILPPLTIALTTPVGYYNGKNLLPLRETDSSSQKTRLAVSPYGAFDMSGNVWEWTESEDPNDLNKVFAKGGCFDSFQEACKVEVKLSLQKDHLDAYTGFRMVR